MTTVFRIEDDEPLGDDTVNVVIFEHDNWDMSLVQEDDGHAFENAISLLQEDCETHDESEFRTSKQTVNRKALEALSEFDG